MRALVHVLALAGMAARAVQAEPTAPATVYPLTARLKFTSEGSRACLVREGDAQDASCRVEVGERLHQAYETVLRRMFRAPATDVPPDVEIAVSLAHADVVQALDSRQVQLETRAVISSPGAGEIDQLASFGRSPILGTAQESIENAAQRASEETAQGLQREFANSELVVNWLLPKGIEPVGSTVAWPPRGDWVTFADVAGGVVLGGGEEPAPGLLAHLGVASRWLFVQAIVGRWGTSFDAGPPNPSVFDQHVPADLTATDLGIEAGPVLRVSPSLELRAGLGGHVLWGSAQAGSGGQSRDFSKVVPTALAALQSSFSPSRGGVRVRFGLEVRRYVSTTVGFPEFSRTIPIADTYVGAYLGFELPWKPRSKRSGEAAQ